MTRQKTHREVILEYLTFIAPRKATRPEIRKQTGLPADQVLNGLLDLQRAGRVQSAVDPPESPRVFWVEKIAAPGPGAAVSSDWRKTAVAPDFETLALTSLCQYFGCHLARRSFPGHNRELIGSEDGELAGDIVYISDTGSLTELEACLRQLASLHAAAPMLIIGGDFDILWEWFCDNAAMASAIRLFFIMPKGEIISLDAENE